MITLALIAGVWSTNCIQTQISNHNQGHVIETYTISETSDYEFKREWFKDANCTEPAGTDIESGTIDLGKEVSSFFNPGKVYEANFSSQNGIDLGAINVRESKYLKVARGMKNSTMRNTMLSLFEFKKKN